jgi:membrane protease YdiL (CAAX protease family)
LTPGIDLRGLLVLLAFAGVCATAARHDGRLLRRVATALMLALTAGFFLHVMPGFDNPRVVSNVVLGTGSLPYTQYLNFDKGLAGMLLLGVYVRGTRSSHAGPPTGGHYLRFRSFTWRFVVMVVVVMAMSLAFGYVRWDPKLPSWWPAWLGAMVFLTALPEEALFRAVVQGGLERALAPSPYPTTLPIVAAGIIFGVAHLAGGPIYVVLASAAGIGYGWIYASTRSISAAITGHAGLNALHFFLFSYPALEKTF